MGRGVAEEGGGGDRAGGGGGGGGAGVLEGGAEGCAGGERGVVQLGRVGVRVCVAHCGRGGLVSGGCGVVWTMCKGMGRSCAAARSEAGGYAA